tara:strand:- start:422 stop:601 length:180 start_codon:yes stop_codon:yes gene_type:complete
LSDVVNFEVISVPSKLSIDYFILSAFILGCDAYSSFLEKGENWNLLSAAMPGFSFRTKK